MITEKIVPLKKLRSLADSLRSAKKKVVFTAGAYDLLHIGQIRFLSLAKEAGDTLVVGIVSDESQKKSKGREFPILGEKIRAEMVAFLKMVDYVILSVDKGDLREPLRRLRPSVFFTVEKDWEKMVRSARETAIVEEHGGQVVKVPYVRPYLSTDDIARKLAFIKIHQLLAERLGETELKPIYE